MTCIEKSNIQLKEHQKKAIIFLNSKENDSLLLVHPTGSGKTLTAVAYSQCFLEENIGEKVIFVGPASLLSNFKKEMHRSFFCQRTSLRTIAREGVFQNIQRSRVVSIKIRRSTVQRNDSFGQSCSGVFFVTRVLLSEQY